jgi:predicted N-acetyltransferase YhbS
VQSTSTGLEIRPAGTADVPAVRRIIAAAFAQYEAVLPPTVFEHYLEDLLAVGERMDHADVLLATTGDELVGTVTFYDDGGDLGMSWPAGWSVFRALAVTPRQRARGTGRALVTACVERAAATGAEVIGLHTASFMTSAVELYGRCGFRRAPGHDITPAAVIDVTGVDDDDLPAVLAYRRDLRR